MEGFKDIDDRYSTSFMAQAVPSHGQIDTIEFSPLHAQHANSTFLALDLYPFPKVHVGPALEILQDPSGPFSSPPGVAEGMRDEDQGYDFVFIDANKDQIHEYFQEAIRLTRKGGVIVVDNAIRNGRYVHSVYSVFVYQRLMLESRESRMMIP